MKTKILVTSLLSVAIASGCTDFRKKEASSTPSDGVPTAVIGMKNGDQMRAAMSRVTGLDQTLPSVSDPYDRVVSNLVHNGTSTAFSNGNFTAYMGVAIPFCQELIRSEASKPAAARKYFGAVDFTYGADSLSQASRSSISVAFAKAALDRDPTDEERSAMVDCMSEMQVSTNSVRDILVCPCALTLTSVEFISI